MVNKSQILLHTPEGVRDIYGNELAAKKAAIASVIQQMVSFGYEEIETPTFEFFDIFSRKIGTTPSRELFKFFDKEGNTLVLRPDFTPAVARCTAKYYMEEKCPIRFCYEGETYSNTSNLQGKLKESTQMGVELLNDPSVEADAESVALLVNSLKAAGLDEFQVCLGNADYFRGICARAEIEESVEYQLREHISGKNYYAAEQLLTIAGIPEEVSEKLLKVSDLIGRSDALAAAEANADNERSLKAVQRLRAVYDVLRDYGVQKYISFDLSMLSKYNYYTGIIFKAFTYGVGDVVATGGRYDDLLAQFGKEAPAVGFMIPVDTLMEALKRQKIEITERKQPEQIFYNADNFREKLAEVLNMRKQGLAVCLLPESGKERGNV